MGSDEEAGKIAAKVRVAQAMTNRHGLIAGATGTGMISSVELAGRSDKPRLFSTFLMWLLADAPMS